MKSETSPELRALTQQLLDALEAGNDCTAGLAQLGAPEPSLTQAALAHAVEDPVLAPTRDRWLPQILLSARPDHAARCLVDLAARHRADLGHELDLAAAPLVPTVLGSSDFLARLLLRHPGWVTELSGDPPPPPEPTPIEPDWTAIRVAKYRALLRIAARDLAGREFEQSLRELSDLADRALQAGMECASLDTGIEAPGLLALGKLGGRELNFSSDVDLLFVYTAPDAAGDLERNAEVAKLVRTLKRHLEEPSEDGFAYRVDLDLRPEGRSGALANSIEAALDYYETFGADWERQALIRLRGVAGDTTSTADFERQITPFVYRAAIDPQAIARVRDMKSRIEAERRSEGRDLEVDVKEGPGGIRDVEFLVQALQLLYGGRDLSIRGGNVIDSLRTLARSNLLPERVAAALIDAYLWLRRAEHCVQLPEERQTQKLPRDAPSQLALARRMGYVDLQGSRARDQYLEDWTAVRAEVRGHFEDLVLQGGPPDA